MFVGTAIGAGIFVIPYTFSQAGVVLGLLYTFGLGFVVLITSLSYGEIVLRTRSPHQLAGYVEHYLGKRARWIATAALVFGIYGALIAYTIQVGNFLFVLLGPIIGGTALIYSLIFIAICGVALLIGLGMVVSVEKVMTFFLLATVGLVVAVSIRAWNWTNLPMVNLQHWFLPYGVILFAFTASSAIPDMRTILGPQQRQLKRAIQYGMLIPFFVYLLFSLSVVFVSSHQTSLDAISGLEGALGGTIVSIGALFGVLAMTTSFLSLGLVLKEMYVYDFHWPKIVAGFTVLAIPLIIFLAQFATFISVISAVGVVMGGTEGILILLTHARAKKMGDRKPEYQLKIPNFGRWTLMTFFSIGILYELTIQLERFFNAAMK
jgi:amino acid permease